MGIMDLCFLAILVICFVSGLQKGLITSFLACIALAGSTFVASALEGRLTAAFLNTDLKGWLEANFDMSAEYWTKYFHVLSFVIVLAISFAALMLIVNLINNMFRMPKLRALDGLLGGALGVVRGYAIICLVVAALGLLLAPMENELASSMFTESALGRFFTSGSSLSDLFGIAAKLNGVG